jgi:hypothetical protein
MKHTFTSGIGDEDSRSLLSGDDIRRWMKGEGDA